MLPRTTALTCASIVLASLAPVRASQYDLDFSRNFNVWSWNHRLGWQRAVAEGLLATTNVRLERNISDSPGFIRRSDGANAGMRVSQVITPRLTLGLDATINQSLVRSGDTRSEVSDAKITSTLHYRPLSGLTFSHSLGQAHETRRNVSDAGLAYGLGLNARPFEGALQRHGVSLVVDYMREGVSSRQGDVLTTLGASGSFAWADWVSQEFQFTGMRDEQNYVSASPGNPIRHRRTEHRALITSITASPPWVGNLMLEGGYTSGLVEDDASTDPNDLKYRTNNRSRGWWGTSTWTLPVSVPVVRYVVSLGRTERVADPVLISTWGDSSISRPNNFDRNTSNLSMSLSSLLTFGERDSIRLSGTLELVRDHTPARTELNDRDEYRRSVVAWYRHRFTRSTALELRIERSETHQVWLTRERSANNRWDRVLNFWATTQIVIGETTFTQRGFFRTALEEFDFDYLTPNQPRSRNSRVGRLDFASEQPLAGRTTASLAYSVEARTHGNLLPAGAGQRPKVWQLTQNELAHVVTVGLTSRLGRSWELGPSISFNRQSEYIPTQPNWNPFRLGNLTDRQEGMQVEAFISFRPTSGFFGGDDAVTGRMSRAYRRRAALRDRTTFVSLVYQHVF